MSEEIVREYIDILNDKAIKLVSALKETPITDAIGIREYVVTINNLYMCINQFNEELKMLEKEASSEDNN